MGAVLRRALATVACIAAVGGCGEDESPSEEARIATIVENYFLAMKKGDGEAACGAMTAAARKQLSRSVRRLKGAREVKSCEQTVAGFLDLLLPPVKIAPGDVSIDGEKAEVDRYIGAGILRLERVDGEWLIAPTAK